MISPEPANSFRRLVDALRRGDAAGRPEADAQVAREFVAVCAAVDAGSSVENGAMLASFAKWNHGEPWSHKRVNQALLRAGHRQSALRRRGRYWLGLRLLPFD